MNEDIEIPNADDDYPRFTSTDIIDVTLDGPEDRTIKPIPPEMMPWALYEQDRIANPTKAPSMPRPGTQPPRAESLGEPGTRLWQKVRGLRGRTLCTDGQEKEFKVDTVQDDYLVVRPREGDPRLILSRMIHQVIDLRLKDDELTLARLREEFPKDRSLSYILAIVHAIS